jgi:hypothetical protein
MKSLPPRLSVSLLLCALLVCAQAPVCLAQKAARARRAEEDPLAAAFRLAGGLEGLQRESFFSSLADEHLRAGRLEEGVRAAAAMEDGTMKAFMFSLLANAFAEAGSLDRAAEVLEESLQTLRRAGDDSMKSELMRLVVGGETFRFSDDFPPMRRVVIKGVPARLLEAGRTEAAAKLLSELRSVALDPDFDDEDGARLLAGVARLYATWDASRAAEVRAEALAAARRAEDEYEKVTTLCEVASAHAAAGDARTAEALLDEAQQFASARETNRDYDLKEIVRAYAAAGLTEKALKAAREMGDEEGAFAALEAAGKGAAPEALKERLKRAVEVAASLEYENERAERLAALATSYGAGSAALLAEVRAAAGVLSGGYYRGRVLLAVGDAHAEAKRKAEALDAWGQALEAARSIELGREDLHPGDSRINDGKKLSLLGALARRLVGAGEDARAPEMARDIWGVHVRARALAEGSPARVRGAEQELVRLADELTGAGRKDLALEVLGVASVPAKASGESANPSDLAPGLASLGAAYARAGDEERAAAYLRRALRAAAEADESEDYKLHLLSSVGARYAEAGLRPDAGARKSLRRLVRDVEAAR